MRIPFSSCLFPPDTLPPESRKSSRGKPQLGIQAPFLAYFLENGRPYRRLNHKPGIVLYSTKPKRTPTLPPTTTLHNKKEAPFPSKRKGRVSIVVYALPCSLVGEVPGVPGLPRLPPQTARPRATGGRAKPGPPAPHGGQAVVEGGSHQKSGVESRGPGGPGWGRSADKRSFLGAMWFFLLWVSQVKPSPKRAS